MYSLAGLVVLVFLLVKSTESRSDAKPWDQFADLYPGLVEPIRESLNDPSSMRRIYMITPTKTRAEQTADLIRLAQTFYIVGRATLILPTSHLFG